MASNKDILDAQKFNRTRLVTAFMSGTPGGRELEPRSHTGPIIVGLIISALIIGGAAIAGRFASKLQNDWQNNTMILVKNSGVRYYALNGVLHPIRNVTSAMLLSQGQLKLQTVESDQLRDIPRGPEIGIQGAPDNPPEARALRSKEWVTCAPDEGAPRTWIGMQPPQLKSAPAFVVSVKTPAGASDYLIVGGKRYQMSPEASPIVKTELQANAIAPVVPASFINLFDAGAAIDVPTIPGSNQAAPKMPEKLKGAKVGQVVKAGSSAENQRSYVIAADGGLVPMSTFVGILYTKDASGNPIQTLTATTADIAASVTTTTLFPADWPERVQPVRQFEGHAPCARSVEKDGVITAELAAAPGIPVKESEEKKKAPVSVADIKVPGGSGALVRGSGGAMGAITLITDDGRRYGLDPGDPAANGGNNNRTATLLDSLGYRASDVVGIPRAWLEVIPSGGVTLSRAAAAGQSAGK